MHLSYFLLFSFALLIADQQRVAVAEVEETKNQNIDYKPYHQQAIDFIQDNGFNQNFYYLVDLGKHPGLKRMYRYDIQKDSIMERMLVTHGACDVNSANPDKWKEAKFSNVPESHCSSKGKFEIGKRDYSSWGINVKYWIKGLESTNDNAVERVVVLHSWEAVPDEEVYPEPIALSWGCPAVSNTEMKKLDDRIQAESNKKILFWIIDSTER